jgi:HAD superfamily hydrolase (TIGR01509 family)
VVQYFEFLMSCEEVGCGKDRPDAFLEAARRLGASPQEIYVYEDSLTALKTAADAGFRTVAVYDPYSGGWDQCAALSDETITDWT